MEQYLETLKNSHIFRSIPGEDLLLSLKCLNPEIKSYEAEETIFGPGDRIYSIGLVLSGWVYLLHEDFFKNKSVWAKINKGETFGETAAFIVKEPFMFYVTAGENTSIMFIDAERIFSPCPYPCKFHSTLILNLLYASQKSAAPLTNKLIHITKSSTREKLLSYFLEESLKNKSLSFEIPLNRRELADFLSVDRSAMSNELSKMKNEGILSFSKNRFTLNR